MTVLVESLAVAQVRKLMNLCYTPASLGLEDYHDEELQEV